MIDHIGLAVKDMDRAKAFYAGALKPLGIGVIMEVTAEQTRADAGCLAARLLDPQQREQFHGRKLAPLDNARVGARLDPVSDGGIGKVRMPAEPGGGRFHPPLDASAKPVRGCEVVHDDQGPARP